jgi:hypothetical protein
MAPARSGLVICRVLAGVFVWFELDVDLFVVDGHRALVDRGLCGP